MDRTVASLFFLGGILLVILGIYNSAGPGIETTMSSLPLLAWSKGSGIQIVGVVFAIMGGFSLVREPDTGEEF